MILRGAVARSVAGRPKLAAKGLSSRTMAPGGLIEDDPGKLPARAEHRPTGLIEHSRMERLQIMMDTLSKSADDADLISLLATSRQARLYNADLARQLRDVVETLQSELNRRESEPLADS